MGFFHCIFVFALLVASTHGAYAAELQRGSNYSVIELEFQGPNQTPTDAPARDIDFWVDFRHETGSPQYRIHGFWDGNGVGGTTGNVFKIRFTPTRSGRWFLSRVHSNHNLLAGQRQGDHVTAMPSNLKGFWEVDDNSAGRRWYKRSNGTHEYIYGNTHYSFISETKEGGLPNGSDITTDIRRNAQYFKKLRFTTMAGRWPHRSDRPFLDDEGDLTQNGYFSHRPNPAWWRNRIDLAVQTAFEEDLIADLILNGVDNTLTRRAIHNDHDRALPYFKYIVARYGAYPNVWICIANEWDIKVPNYTQEEVRMMGQQISALLPYATPLSIHGDHGNWTPGVESNPPWHDHIILQKKLRAFTSTVDFMVRNYDLGASFKPVVNDELAYEGEGDQFTESHTIASHIGAFLGGGYATTGSKYAIRRGQYFWGNFSADEHMAADNLKWFREKINERMSFWRMQPVDRTASIFLRTGSYTRVMEWRNHEYVLGSADQSREITANLPPGQWVVRKLNVWQKTDQVIARSQGGELNFRTEGNGVSVFHFKNHLEGESMIPSAPQGLRLIN